MLGFVRVSPRSKQLPGGLVVVVAARRDPVPFPCSGGVVLGAREGFSCPSVSPVMKRGQRCPLGGVPWGLHVPRPGALVAVPPVGASPPPHVRVCVVWGHSPAPSPRALGLTHLGVVAVVPFQTWACIRCFFFVFIFTFLFLDQDFLGSRAPCCPRNGLLSLPHLPKRRRSRCCLLRSLSRAWLGVWARSARL